MSRGTSGFVCRGTALQATKTHLSEGYGLQAVRKCFAMNLALAAEGTPFIVLPTLSASCLAESLAGKYHSPKQLMPAYFIRPIQSAFPNIGGTRATTRSRHPGLGSLSSHILYRNKRRRRMKVGDSGKNRTNGIPISSPSA